MYFPVRFSSQLLRTVQASIVTSCLILGSAVQSVLATQNVLVIHSYHDGVTWTQGVRAGIDLNFQDSESEVIVSHEYLDAKRYPNIPHGEAFLQKLAIKYKEKSPDLIIVSDDPALQLLLRQRQVFFPEKPIIFLGINKVDPKLFKVPNMSGVFEKHSTVETILGALEYTQSDQIIVVNDTTETGIANLGGIDALREHPDAPKEIIIMNDIVAQEVKQRFSSHSSHWPVIVLGQLRQSRPDGSLLSFAETAQILRKTLLNPLYAEAIVFQGHGVVGGKVLEAEYHAGQAVTLAKEVLRGVPVDVIPPITNAKTLWVFDKNELERFKIPVDSLPQGSKILNQPESFYERYKIWVWLIIIAFGVTILIILLLIEILRRRAVAAKMLREHKQRYKDFSEAGAHIFWELDENLLFIYISGDTQDLNGMDSVEFVGQSFQSIIVNDTRFEFNWELFVETCQSRNPIRDFTFRCHEGNEILRIYRLNGNPMFDELGKFRGYRGIMREITKEYNLAETLAYQATYDWLTGLINRREFDNCLQNVIRRCHTFHSQAVLCYIDLDQFKIVNDTAGHCAGDRLITELAHLLQRSIRDADILGRLGGDEFGLILEGCSLTKAQQICTSLVEAIQSYRFAWQGRQFNVGCSIGLVPILDQSIDAVDLLSRADIACYRAKELGRNRIHLYTPENIDLASHQTVMTYIANISQSIEENRFFLLKQKIKAISDQGKHRSHFEVLLRFRNNDNKIISPAQLIPAAERYGVISLIDRWVLETVLASLEQSQETSLISINLSGLSISDKRFLDYAMSLVKQSQIPTNHLCFEITETAAISHFDEAQKFIYQMKNLGVRFALDDFGSGQASFGYLKSLPVDFLKIDGGLVKNIVNDPIDFEMVRFVNDIAHMMGMETIAEFVENTAILELLREIEVNYAQGYGIAHPESLKSPTLIV